ALVALAGVLVVSGTRGFLPGLLAVLALAGAAGLVWYGAMRTLPSTGGGEEPYEDGDYAEDYDGEYADQGYDGEYADREYPEAEREEPVYAAPPAEPAEPGAPPVGRHAAPTRADPVVPGPRHA